MLHKNHNILNEMNKQDNMLLRLADWLFEFFSSHKQRMKNFIRYFVQHKCIKENNTNYRSEIEIIFLFYYFFRMFFHHVEYSLFLFIYPQ